MSPSAGPVPPTGRANRSSAVTWVSIRTPSGRREGSIAVPGSKPGRRSPASTGSSVTAVREGGGSPLEQRTHSTAYRSSSKAVPTRSTSAGRQGRRGMSSWYRRTARVRFHTCWPRAPFPVPRGPTATLRLCRADLLGPYLPAVVSALAGRLVVGVADRTRSRCEGDPTSAECPGYGASISTLRPSSTGVKVGRGPLLRGRGRLRACETARVGAPAPAGHRP